MKQIKSKLGYVGNIPGTIMRDSDSWYTPLKYITSAKKILGKIELDPFSSFEANKTIKAKRIYTIDNSSLSQEWNARSVWMNPPYSRGLINKAVDKFIIEWASGRIGAGIVLVNASTDSKAFHRLIENCSCVCFTLGRIAFENIDGKNISGNTKGQAFFYFGNNVELFLREFKQYGKIMVTI
jgi:phage N-6-adenine-methyltransferase